MADPLSLALSAADKLLLQFKNVKTNHAECELLEQLVANTLKLLHQLEPRVFDAPTTTALELVKDALEEVQQAVNKCCNSAFFTSLLHNESYALALKQAAEKLAHALSQMPLASLGMTADVQSDVVALSKQIRNAKFEERAAMAHQTIALKDAFEKAFNQGGQGTEDIKNLIQEVLHHQCSSTEEMRKELAMLKEHAHEAKKNKEKQQEFELNQIIAVVSASLGEVIAEPRVLQDLEDCFRCPISKEIMKDPVVLKDSGMTYERSSIIEWFRRGHRHDPLTNVEVISTELVPNHTFRKACQTLLEHSKSSSSIMDAPQEEKSRLQVTPGLYEGHGKIAIGSSFVHVWQLLIVEPNGKVLGYSLYKSENIIVEENVLEVGGGEWNDITNEVSFGDNQYSYKGLIDFGVDYLQSELNWSGTVTKANAQGEEHNFGLTYSHPPIQRSIALHPIILQMESGLDTVGSKVKYKSKIVLSLEVDSTIGGWMWFESLEQGSKLVGRIIEGRWEYDGTLSFPVYFLDQDTPLNSDATPTNHSASFKISGNVSQDERFSHSKFRAVTTRARNEGVRRNKELTNVLLDDIPMLEYSLVRESSIPWHHLHPNPVKLFNMSRSMLTLAVDFTRCVHKAYELRSVDYSVKANFDLSYGSFSHYLRTWGRTPLHIAAWNNSTSIVKELIARRVDKNVKDNNGQSPLHHATSNNSFDVVKELIAKRVKVDIKDDYGKTPLCIAFDKKFANVIKELLNNGANINVQENDGSTILHHATFNNSIDVIKLLLSKGANMNIQDKQGRSPLQIALDKNMTDVIELFDNKATIDLQDNIGWSKLHHAANHNDIDIVKKLISKGASIDLQDNDGQTPMYIASYSGHINIVKELIVNGANVNLQRNDEASPLYIASQKGHTEVVKELIVNGADFNLQDNYGSSPLHIASRSGHIDIVKELIVNGADVNLQDIARSTPLSVASLKGHTDIVKELIGNGADVNLQNIFGKSPLYVASQEGHTDIVKELIANGADVNLQNNHGWTPLYVASEEGHIDIVKELIVNGADVNLQDNDGASPLYIASEMGHIDIVKELIVNGADVNLRDDDGRTPLYVASREGHIDIVKELIVNGADVNLLNNDGSSPLLHASLKGHIDIVKELIANGANVNLQNNNGWTPLLWASSHGRVSIVKILLENGASKRIRNNQGETPYDVVCNDLGSGSIEDSIIRELHALLRPPLLAFF